ncbi:MAG TPA: ATP-binding protein [bacterium]|nr:ATP-binding protein [bacterium]
MYIKRNIEFIIKKTIKNIPIIGITGPRQSGKTTLVKHLFPKYKYISLENPDNRDFAINDPKNFLATYNNKIIFDEIQRVPELFSYIQEVIDTDNFSGRYILTGSNNFLLMEQISQTLAGRIILFNLLPFSYSELSNSKFKNLNIDDIIYHGLYPRCYDTNISTELFFQTYINTYIERDVRQLKNISNLLLFQKFIKLCAARIGKELNQTSLGNEIGVDHKTVNAWFSILEASYILYKLPPYYKNINKRLIKSPKIYFYDTGLVCSLLGLKTIEHLKTHYLYGELFENFVINELTKYYLHSGFNSELFFLKDKTGHEIDCVIDSPNSFIAIEIKSGSTVSDAYFKNLKYYSELNDGKTKNNFVVYSGIENQSRQHGKIINWKNLPNIFKIIRK